MGGTVSLENLDSTEISTNECIALFASDTSIPENDSFWENFTTFTLQYTTSKSIDEMITNKLKEVNKNLIVNNLKTGNLAKLMNFAISNSKPNLLIPSTSDVSIELRRLSRCRCLNAMVLCRYFLKYLIEHCKSDRELLQHFFIFDNQDNPEEYEGASLEVLSSFTYGLINLITTLPLDDSTYFIHVESVTLLIVLLSRIMFSNLPAYQIVTYKIVFEYEYRDLWTATLLGYFIHQPKRPNEKFSGLLGLATGLWSFLYDHVSGHQTDIKEDECPLSSRSALLLLVLINYYRHQPTSGDSIRSDYRFVLSNYTENMGKLFKVLSNNLSDESNMLLLYHFLHCNVNFKNYLLACSDIENIVIPILQRIYSIAQTNCHRLYMSMIILLILTEDQLFNKTVHTTIMKNVTWYSERTFSEISLGGLIVLILVRTVQYNLLRTRDKYLHTNCLAAFANMSTHFQYLNTYICQRIVTLFEVLSKTHGKENVDVFAVEEAIRIVLEAINSCLYHQLIHNTSLVYTLMYNKRVLEPFKEHESLHDIVQNIELVIAYFTNKLEKEGEQCADANEIMEKVRRWAVQWPKDMMKKFPDLQFKYIEEEKPEDFFIPYVWSLIGEYSGIYWDSAAYKL